MDNEVSFVKQADVFPVPKPGTSRKSPIIRPNTGYSWPRDEKLMRYDSSPESMISYADENSFSPLQPDNHLDRPDLCHVLRQYLFPYQDEILVAAAFPIALDRLEESLIMTFLTDYAESHDDFSPCLRPHPNAITLATSMVNPVLLHCILAITAQYRLSRNDFYSVSEQRDLEYATVKHRGEAIQLVRGLSNAATVRGKQDGTLVTSSIALGMLDQFSFEEETASMHFRAARRFLQSTDGCLYFQSAWMTRVMIHFETSVGTNKESYIWDFKDFSRLHAELNQFFNRFWSFGNTIASRYKTTRQSMSQDGHLSPSTQSRQHPPCLTPDSTLTECLAQTPYDPTNPTIHERQELLFQLGSLLTMSNVMVDLQTDPHRMKAYIDSIHELVPISQIQGRSSNNLMWLLQSHDPSLTHTELIQAAAGWVWILRHVNFSVQRMVKDWLIAILTGRSVLRPLKLDAFAFSYAS